MPLCISNTAMVDNKILYDTPSETMLPKNMYCISLERLFNNASAHVYCIKIHTKIAGKIAQIHKVNKIHLLSMELKSYLAADICKSI